jgi:uncharacterized protein (TIGR02453 family)
MANTFKGFPADAVDFLAKLEANNNRDWFNAHKADYERACKVPMEELLDDLDQKFGSGGSKVYRIYRDVRFSKDKTPYKTFQAAHFAAGYLSLGPDGLYVGTGAFMLDGPTLERYRKAVGDDRTGAELVKAQAALKKKGYVVEGHGDALKTVPRGYDKDHPRAELLKQKSVLVGKNFAPSEINTAKLVAGVTKVITDVKPLTTWLDANVWM